MSEKGELEIQNGHKKDFSEKLKEFDLLKNKVLSPSGNSEGKEIDSWHLKMIKEFYKKIEAKYPDYQNYVLYHRLIGGTPPESCEKFDFPGDDSVVKFFLNLKKEDPIQLDIDFEECDKVAKEFGVTDPKLLSLRGNQWMILYFGKLITIEEWKKIMDEIYDNNNRTEKQKQTDVLFHKNN